MNTLKNAIKLVAQVGVTLSDLRHQAKELMQKHGDLLVAGPSFDRLDTIPSPVEMDLVTFPAKWDGQKFVGGEEHTVVDIHSGRRGAKGKIKLSDFSDMLDEAIGEYGDLPAVVAGEYSDYGNPITGIKKSRSSFTKGDVAEIQAEEESLYSFHVDEDEKTEYEKPKMKEEYPWAYATFWFNLDRNLKRKMKDAGFLENYLGETRGKVEKAGYELYTSGRFSPVRLDQGTMREPLTIAVDIRGPFYFEDEVEQIGEWLERELGLSMYDNLLEGWGGWV
jgi:hypothetical protein